MRKNIVNREEIKEAIKVMQARLDGEEIECKYSDTGAWTQTNARPTFDFKNRQYRIKRKPRTIYVNIYNDDSISEGKFSPSDLDYITSSDDVEMIEFIEVFKDE